MQEDQFDLSQYLVLDDEIKKAVVYLSVVSPACTTHLCIRSVELIERLVLSFEVPDAVVVGDTGDDIDPFCRDLFDEVWFGICPERSEEMPLGCQLSHSR